MLYWLVVFDDAAQGRNLKKDTVFYLPKVLLTAMIGGISFFVFLWTFLGHVYNPTSSTWSETMHFTFFSFLAVILLGVYFLWAALLVLPAVQNSYTKSKLIQFNFVLSLFAMFGICFYILAGAFEPEPMNTANFIGIYGLINSYMWISAAANLPLSDEMVYIYIYILY